MPQPLSMFAIRPVIAKAVSRPSARATARLVITLAVTIPWASTSGAAVQAIPIGTFENPVYVTVAPGRTRLLFVVERPGQIQVLKDERRLDTAFLDIRDLVMGIPDVDAGGEQGLLSVAFAPDYVTSGRFYVAFTNHEGALEIDEFQRAASTQYQADRGTRRVVLVIPHPGAKNHNGGQLQFGPKDGLLYISTGDGGNLTPPGEPARDIKSLLGKILRINPLKAGSRPYTVPKENPFVGRLGRDEVFAYGLRHPWRFSFDGTRIAIADVGQTEREEINFLNTNDALGVNFGWPQYEGDLVFDNTRPGPGPAIFPMFTYTHAGPRCAVIGGYVVRDPGLPTLKGRYLYGDACTGEVRSFIPKVGAQSAVDDQPIGITLSGLGSFGLGFGGQIYFAQVRGGTVSRLEPSSP